jgi:hypothetical protein
MSSSIDDYNLILEQNEVSLKIYALQQLNSQEVQIAFQKLQLLYSTKDNQFLDHLYKYTQLFNDSIKNHIVLEHLEKHHNFSPAFLDLLSTFSWDKSLLKLLLVKINEADFDLQSKLILLLGQYRFLLPELFIQRYLFSKSSEVSITTFAMLSKVPLAQDEKIFKENLKHPNLQVVASCYAGLWKLGNTTLLLAFTSDHQDVLQSALVASREIFADERVLNHLQRYLKSRDTELALLALAACTHKNSVEMLIGLIVENEINFIDQALKTSLNLDPERSINHLLNYLEIYESTDQDTADLLNLIDQAHIWSRNTPSNQLSEPTIKQLQNYSKQASESQLLISKRNKFAHYFLTPKHVNDDSWPTPLFES